MGRKRIEVIAVGDEILRGVASDINSATIGRLLSRVGLQVQRATALPDDVQTLVAAFREAASRSDVVIVTGGLGPTVDDVTKEAVARAFDLELEYREYIVKNIEERFGQRGCAMPEGYRDQGRIPRDSFVIENPLGLAVGLRIQAASCDFFLLPGVPAEMNRMLEESVIPALGASGVDFSIRVRTFGLPECDVQDRLASVLSEGALREVSIISSAEGVDVYLDRDTGNEALERITKSLGVHAYTIGDESLAEVVVKLLVRNRLTVSVAESITGGLIASMIVSVSGASEVFREGTVAYSNEAKVERLGVSPTLLMERGAVSREVCMEMATGERIRSKTDYAIATTGIAGPTGATLAKPLGLCYIGVSTPVGTFVRKYHFTGDRNFVRKRAASSALDMLRLAIIDAKDLLASFSVDGA